MCVSLAKNRCWSGRDTRTPPHCATTLLFCPRKAGQGLQALQRFHGGIRTIYLCCRKRSLTIIVSAVGKECFAVVRTSDFRSESRWFDSSHRSNDQCSSEPSPSVASLKHSKCRRKGLLRFDKPGVAGSSPACDKPRPRTKRRCRSITVAQPGRARFRPFRLLPCFHGPLAQQVRAPGS